MICPKILVSIQKQWSTIPKHNQRTTIIKLHNTRERAEEPASCTRTSNTCSQTVNISKLKVNAWDRSNCLRRASHGHQRNLEMHIYKEINIQSQQENFTSQAILVVVVFTYENHFTTHNSGA